VDSILITGGAGFIGSHLAARLAQDGRRVVVVDNFDPYYDPALKRANILPLVYSPTASVVEADIRDGAEIERIVRDYGVRRIVHLAAMSGVRYSIEHTPLYTAVNVGGTVNVLEAARKHGVELVLSASTSTTYGNVTPVPFQEDAAADRPLAAYAATKRAAELMAHTYTNLFGLNVTVLRFFNVYGPNGRPDMMPLRTLDAIVQGREITLFEGGRLRRDWTYIDDIVDGIQHALDKPLGYEILNLGYGHPYAMTEFVQIMEELTGRAALVRDVPGPASEPAITFADNRKARALIGFDLQVSLPEGLARTWAWYRRKHGLVQSNAQF